MSRVARRVLSTVLAAGCSILLSSSVGAQLLDSDADQTKQIVMVTFRGCEDACQGFLDYVDTANINADVIVRDLGRDKSLLPSLVEEVRALNPDLLVTWGTSVTRGMIGTVGGDHSEVVTGVPTVFMIVADPVGAEIVDSFEDSGRPLVTGTRNRVPEETQMRVLADYRPFSKIGLIYKR